MDTFVTKAARLNGPRDIELIERELVCGEDDIIVKNHLMGICGSDKNFYRGYLPPKTAEFRQDPKFPFLLGHESGGTVVAVGSRVADYKVGDKVMAFGWNNNFAEYFAAKSFQLQPVPYGLDMDIASLGEPISCAMYSGLNSGVQLGDTVVVMGGGFAGQIIAQCARRKGAYRVIVVDVLEGKLALARRLGADITLNPGQDDVIEAVKDLTNGLGADVVVEAAGTAESFNTASEIIKHNGKFVFYSWVTTPVTLNISRWHDDGLEFINTCLVHHTWQQRYVWCPEALRPVAQGLVDVKPLITDEFKLDDIKAGFDLADKDDAAITIVFRPYPGRAADPASPGNGIARPCRKAPASPPVGTRRCARKTKEETMSTCPDCETGRNLLAGACRSVFQRGLTGGSAGNMSLRVEGGILATPTGIPFGELTPGNLSLLDETGALVSGPKATKEAPFHLAWYKANPDHLAVVHLHSPWAVAVSCLADLDPGNPLPPLTPYQLMKLGHLAVTPYAKPGSAELCAGVARLAPGRTALLMANHGSITGGASLTKALDAAEELEATCRLYLTLRGLPVRCLTPEQAAELLPPKGA